MDAGGGLVIFDIDNYKGDVHSDALEAVLALPETFTVQTAHVQGRHRYYNVTGEVVDKLRETFGTPKGNLCPSWGEVRVNNQYVVAPGSQLDGCNKDWCTDCESPTGGRYEIATNVRIATIDVADVIDVLQVDPSCSSPKDATQSGSSGGEADPSISQAGQSEGTIDPTEKDLTRMQDAIEEFWDDNATTDRAQTWTMDLLRGKYKKQGFHERSGAETALASVLFGILHASGETDRAREAIYAHITNHCCQNPTTDWEAPRKWQERDDSYRRDVINYAIDNFDPEVWDRWQRKKYRLSKDNRSGDYSDATYAVVYDATERLAGQRYPTKQEVIDLAQELDPSRAASTHDTALKRLRREQGQVKMAYLGGNKYVCYPASKEDPKDAEWIRCNREKWNP